MTAVIHYSMEKGEQPPSKTFENIVGHCYPGGTFLVLNFADGTEIAIHERHISGVKFQP
jgi:hypothetical protein